MARAMSDATISLGLVSVAVRIYPATRPSAGMAFHLLHNKDGSRLRQQYICAKDGEVVPRQDMLKGYEFAKDQYVTFTADELKALDEKADQTIAIVQFVPLQKVDPIYYDRPYYLAPDKGGEKAYRLLVQVMDAGKRAAIAHYAARDRQYLVMLRVASGAQGGQGLVMQQLLYDDEVLPFAEIPIPEAKISEAEVRLAEQVVEQSAQETFDPKAFHNEARERVEAAIQRKVAGQEISVAAAPERPGQIIDLMQALRASLKERGDVKDERKPARSADRNQTDEPQKAQRSQRRKGGRRDASG
jgi:DNA end-binding protein Ku